MFFFDFFSRPTLSEGEGVKKRLLYIYKWYKLSSAKVGGNSIENQIMTKKQNLTPLP